MVLSTSLVVHANDDGSFGKFLLCLLLVVSFILSRDRITPFLPLSVVLHALLGRLGFYIERWSLDGMIATLATSPARASVVGSGTGLLRFGSRLRLLVGGICGARASGRGQKTSLSGGGHRKRTRLWETQWQARHFDED
jgi:hypothetical protein